MKKITKKELNERLKEIKEKCFDDSEKIIFRSNDIDNNILLTIKTVDEFGFIKEYTFYNFRDYLNKIMVMNYYYNCDIENGRGLYL